MVPRAGVPATDDLLIVEAIGSDGRRYFRSWRPGIPRR
jgi:hypothetical protein